jgi:hypothetical protein
MHASIIHTQQYGCRSLNMSEPDSESFAASLNAGQRQFLLRLFDNCLGTKDDPLRWQALLELHGRLRTTSDNDPRPPFSVAVTVPGQAVVTVGRRLLHWQAIWNRPRMPGWRN